MSQEDDISRLLPYLYSREQAAATARAIADFVDARIREAMKPPETSEPGDTLVPHAADCASRRSAVVGAGGNRIGASMQPLPCSCDYWERALAANVKLAKPVPVQPEATACACAAIQAADPSRHFKGCALRVERESEATASDEDVCRCTHVSAHPSLYGCPYHECFVCGDPAFEFSDDGGGPHDYRCAGHSRRRTPEAKAHKTSESGNDSDRVRGTPIAVTDAPAIAPKEPALSHPAPAVQHKPDCPTERIGSYDSYTCDCAAPVGAKAPEPDLDDVLIWPEPKAGKRMRCLEVALFDDMKMRADLYEKTVEALRELHASYVLECEDKCGVCSRCVAVAFLAAHDAASTRKRRRRP